MAPSTPLVVRAAEAQAGLSQNSMTGIIIAGIVVACVIFVGVLVWLGIRRYRKKASAKREEKLGSGFLAVRGVKREDGQDGLAVKGNLFSRDGLSGNVVLPEKAVLPPDASKEQIIEHYSAEGTLPRPFAPYMGDNDTLTPPSPVADKRSSTASWMSFGRHSFLSANSSPRFSVASTVSSSNGGGQRKVHQIFNPVLPDELVISLGEHLTIVNSYDDGWCIVGRDGLSGPELGAVPAWCFIKSSPGLRAERPLRTTSLGVTINLDVPDTRSNLVSWSNF
ncbi:hypothetical protein ABKN59_004994 [Abortiporus biennis]